MTEPMIPPGLVEVRRTPVFDRETLPAGLARTHRTTVWAELVVIEGSVDFREVGVTEPRALCVRAGDKAVIVPNVAHRIELADGARFFVRFLAEPT